MTTTMRSPVGDKAASNPDLSRNVDNPNVNIRKRKCHTDLDDMTSLQLEIREMLNSFKADKANENAKLYEAIDELRTQNKEIIKTNTNIERILENTTSMYNDLKEKVNKISIEHDDALLKINNLEDQVEELQRAQKIAVVELRNIPESENENLYSILSVMHSSLQLPFSPDHMKQVRRLNNPPKAIIAEFQTIQQSKALMQAIRKYNKLNPGNKYNTSCLNMEGDQQMIYISESLTPRARKLHYFARDLRKNYNYKYCWTWQGKVFVKQEDGSRPIWIKSEQQIEALKVSNPSQ